jgi:hypothetical protein
MLCFFRNIISLGGRERIWVHVLGFCLLPSLSLVGIFEWSLFILQNNSSMLVYLKSIYLPCRLKGRSRGRTPVTLGMMTDDVKGSYQARTSYVKCQYHLHRDRKEAYQDSE